MKDTRKDTRITTRMNCEERAKIERLIRAGKFRNMSHVVRAALNEFLSKQ